MKKRKKWIRIMAGFLALIMILSLIIVGFSGCSFGSNGGDEGQSGDNTTQGLNIQGNTFLNSGFKIKSKITPQNALTLDSLIFEVYVDGSGNGNGLVGYQDKVYDLVIVNDKIHIRVSNDIIADITDITGHLIPTSLNLDGQINISNYGFSFLDGNVNAYRATVNDLMIDNVYQSILDIYEPAAVAQGNTMSINAFIDYILNNTNTSVNPNGTLVESGPTTYTKESFYVDSDLGVTIHGKKYSIGDYCNYKTYFEELTPSGIAPSYARNKDVTVQFFHISYVSSEGKTEFMTGDGYVQAMETTTNFEFLNLKNGMTRDEVRALMVPQVEEEGEEDIEAEERQYSDEELDPNLLYEGLSFGVDSGSPDSIVFVYDDITITLKFTNEVLTGIKLEKYIDFLG